MLVLLLVHELGASACSDAKILKKQNRWKLHAFIAYNYQ